jgi:hypothetical protein
MVSGQSASLLPKAGMPVPYRTTFGRLPVLPSIGSRLDDQGRTVAIYDVAAKTGSVGIVPGYPQTPVIGYEGLVPARRIDAQVGTRHSVRQQRCRPTCTVRHPCRSTTAMPAT